MPNLKSYLVTIDSTNYAIHLNKDTYDGIKDVIGLKDMPNPAPDNLRQASVEELEKNGLAHKISIGLATTAEAKITKRKILFCPSTKAYKNVVGKTIGTLHVKSACVKTHRNFV